MPNIDTALVKRLIHSQFPQWEELPVTPVLPGGWDNRTFRLGEDMSVRLPSAERYMQQVAKEQRWLPWLAPQLPMPIPVPLACGRPEADYPWPWSVYSWLAGEPATHAGIADMNLFASDLAHFLRALQRLETCEAPPPGEHNFFRGGPLRIYDAETRQAISRLGDAIDAQVALAIWQKALHSAWRKAPVWIHGDVSAANLLLEKGRLSAVIDFGSCGVGDPACDLTIAWTLLQGDSRELFYKTLALDPHTWARSRGWALWKALITLAAHRHPTTLHTLPAWHVLKEVLQNDGF